MAHEKRAPQDGRTSQLIIPVIAGAIWGVVMGFSWLVFSRNSEEKICVKETVQIKKETPKKKTEINYTKETSFGKKVKNVEMHLAAEARATGMPSSVGTDILQQLLCILSQKPGSSQGYTLPSSHAESIVQEIDRVVPQGQGRLEKSAFSDSEVAGIVQRVSQILSQEPISSQQPTLPRSLVKKIIKVLMQILSEWNR